MMWQIFEYPMMWRMSGRHYDRQDPEAADQPNQAINHAATAIEAAATIAVAATGTIPQLGFIHEDSSNAFCLDIADLYRDRVAIPVAFEAVQLARKDPQVTLERHVRRLAGRRLKEGKVIPAMIDRIKEMLEANDDSSDT
jgi:CRISPR-associated protein Cas1